MPLLNEFIEKAKKSRKRIVFPEGTDARILEAACLIKKEEIGIPVLLGKKETIENQARQLGISSAELPEIIEPESSPDFPELVNLYVGKRKNVSRPVAEKLVKRELVFGGMLVTSGKADAMIAGAVHTTASVIQAAALTIGYQEGISTSSSFFIMSFSDGKTLFYADCAVNVDPEAEQLAEIGIVTARSYKKLMPDEPRVAFLSFSTKCSASHVLADKVINAVKIAKEKSSDIMLDGEFQADTALVAEVAKKKVKEPGEVAGRANVLIFPDLNAGNISYKLTQYLAKAEAYGPILQGFAKPVSDLSRGAKVKDIVGVAAIISLQA